MMMTMLMMIAPPPLACPCGLEKEQPALSPARPPTPAVPGRLARIETAARDHPLRAPSGVEKVPRLLCLDDWRV